MTSFIFHRKNTSPTEYTFVRWIHLNHRKVDLSIGVRLPVLDMYEEMKVNLAHTHGLDEQAAGETAYSNILPELQTELRRIFLQRLQWIQQQRKIQCIRK